MKDETGKRIYDHAYDLGVKDAKTGERKHVNPWKPAKWDNGCHYYWRLGFEDGFAGHTRRMLQAEYDALQLKGFRMLAERVAAMNGVICTCVGEHGDLCPVQQARTLLAVVTVTA